MGSRLSIARRPRGAARQSYRRASPSTPCCPGVLSAGPGSTLRTSACAVDAPMRRSVEKPGASGLYFGDRQLAVEPDTRPLAHVGAQPVSSLLVMREEDLLEALT